jgi:hypothetical protein
MKRVLLTMSLLLLAGCDDPSVEKVKSSSLKDAQLIRNGYGASITVGEIEINSVKYVVCFSRNGSAICPVPDQRR